MENTDTTPMELDEAIVMVEMLNRLCRQAQTAESRKAAGALALGAAKLLTQVGNALSGLECYEVILLSSGQKKINCIKLVRDLTKLGLKDAKDLVEQASHHNPKVVVTGLSREEAKRVLYLFQCNGDEAQARLSDR